MVKIRSGTAEIFLIWTNVARTNIARTNGARTNVARTNVAWTNIIIEICSRCSQELKPLRFCQNRVNSSRDIADIELVWVGGSGWWWWCKVIFT